MRSQGFGLSWVLDRAPDVVVRSLAPDFVFCDADTYLSTNVADRLFKRDVEAYVSVDGPFSLLAHDIGWPAAISASMRDDAGEKIASYMPRVLETVQRVIDRGADAVVLAEDISGDEPILTEEFVLEQLLPHYAKVGEVTREADVPLIHHSDGDVRWIYAALESAGFDGVHISHPVRSTVGELFALADDYGLIPLGGIVSRLIDEDPRDDAAFVRKLVESGPALICDDGGAQKQEEFARIAEILRLSR